MLAVRSLGLQLGTSASLLSVKKIPPPRLRAARPPGVFATASPQGGKQETTKPAAKTAVAAPSGTSALPNILEHERFSKVSTFAENIEKVIKPIGRARV